MSVLSSLLFPVNPAFESKYNYFVSAGKASIPNRSFVFSILCRNAAERLYSNVEILKNLLTNYEVAAYKIVIYENDSEDETKNILDNLQRYDKNIICKSEDLGRQMFGPVKSLDRTKALAEYRNYNLQYIKEHFLDYDYVVVVDIDFLELLADSFYHSLGVLETSDVSAMSGNAYQLYSDSRLWNYDCWAYRENWWVDWSQVQTPHILNNGDSMSWFGTRVFPIGLNPYIVNSGFGGMAIYNTKDYVQGEYTGTDCEHVTFHMSLKNNLERFYLGSNPSQVMLMPLPNQ